MRGGTKLACNRSETNELTSKDPVKSKVASVALPDMHLTGICGSDVHLLRDVRTVALRMASIGTKVRRYSFYIDA